MLGSYPSLNLHDPETYIATICTLLSGYPLWAGRAAVNKATGSEENKFIPPSRAILKPLLEAEVVTARSIARWDAIAEQSVLRLEGPPPAPKPTMEELRAKYGPNWGIDQGRPRQPTKTEARAELIAQIGQEAFDALPDAGIRTDDWQKLKAPPTQLEAAE